MSMEFRAHGSLWLSDHDVSFHPEYPFVRWLYHFCEQKVGVIAPFES